LAYPTWFSPPPRLSWPTASAAGCRYPTNSSCCRKLKDLLLFFSVLAWVAAGFWLNVYSKPDAPRIHAILRDSARQVGYGALGLFVFIVFGLRLQYQISRPFLATFIFTSWFFLAGFRIAARNLIPALSREFGLKRYILVVGLGARAERLARTLESYYEDGIRIVGFLAPPDSVPTPAFIRLDREYPVLPLDTLRAMMASTSSMRFISPWNPIHCLPSKRSFSGATRKACAAASQSISSRMSTAIWRWSGLATRRF